MSNGSSHRSLKNKHKWKKWWGLRGGCVKQELLREIWLEYKPTSQLLSSVLWCFYNLDQYSVWLAARLISTSCPWLKCWKWENEVFERGIGNQVFLFFFFFLSICCEAVWAGFTVCVGSQAIYSMLRLMVIMCSEGEYYSPERGRKEGWIHCE